jgi:hypothetical protein
MIISADVQRYSRQITIYDGEANEGQTKRETYKERQVE